MDAGVLVCRVRHPRFPNSGLSCPAPRIAQPFEGHDSQPLQERRAPPLPPPPPPARGLESGSDDGIALHRSEIFLRKKRIEIVKALAKCLGKKPGSRLRQNIRWRWRFC